MSARHRTAKIVKKKACGRKAKFDNILTVTHAATLHKCQYYDCLFCDGWHLTTKEVPNKNLKRLKHHANVLKEKSRNNSEPGY